MESKTIAQIVAQAMEDKKARDISVLQLEDLTPITDYFVISNGGTRTQTQAIAENVEKKVTEAGVQLLRKEGYQEGRWILLDFGSVIAHIFQDEDRLFYNLERLWGDAPRLNLK
ncbi:MAG: ribosome silencing factor [Peptococcia bacterium]